MKKISNSEFLIFVFSVLLYSCAKEGKGGKVEVDVIVRHHEKLIPAALVYIKYGATEFPGKDVSKYDDNKSTGTAGEEIGRTHFSELKWGDYFFYAAGYDSSLKGYVSGGTPLKIKWKERKQAITLNLPVKE